MKYCLVVNNQIIEGPCTLPQNSSNVSNFNILSNEELKTYGWLPYRVIDVKQENQVLVQSVIDIFANEVVETKIYRDMILSEIEERNQNLIKNKWDRIRQKRNRLLKESDWSQLNDSPVDKLLWSNYRQELRDVPQNYSDPDTVIWPTTPN